MRFWLMFLLSLNLLAGQLTPLVLGNQVDSCEAGCPCDDEDARAESSHDDDHGHEESLEEEEHHGTHSITTNTHEADTAEAICSLNCSDCDCDISPWIGLLSNPTLLLAGYPIEYPRHAIPSSRRSNPSFEIFIPPKRTLA
jgi:hypothetical protein